MSTPLEEEQALPSPDNSARPQPTSRWDGKQPIDQALVPLFPPPSFKRKYENGKENKQTRKPSCTKTVLPHKGKVSLRSILGLSEALSVAAVGPGEGPRGAPAPGTVSSAWKVPSSSQTTSSRRPRPSPPPVYSRVAQRKGVRGVQSADSTVLTRRQGLYIRETHCTGSHRPARK